MKRLRLYVLAAGIVAALVLAGATAASLRPVDAALRDVMAAGAAPQLRDRYGQVLTVTYQSRWNSHETVVLHDMPPMLKDAFIAAEDRQFFVHGGVDWRARFGAAMQNVRSGRAVRGASTITEQVVRMINPRPRNLWSKWLEGFEAAALERKARKADILEFYLNQIPYAANRRGVTQAARYYFGRDLSTLSSQEMLALAVLARAPSAYDLYRHPGRIDGPLRRLAAQMERDGILFESTRAQIENESLAPGRPAAQAQAVHFSRYVRGAVPAHLARNGVMTTTLDARIQRQVQDILDQRVRALALRKVANAAALVADHRTGEIVAWVVAGGGADGEIPAAQIDAVITPRQPGSALKPFLYALALEKGWTAATMLLDAPVAEAVGTGLHRFRNYSNVHYGDVSVREALGNSLNIPALRTIQFTGTAAYLETLHRLGFSSLDLAADFYDEGLALGAGEVSLLELVRGYATIANRGVYREFRAVEAGVIPAAGRRVFTPETTSLVGDILSDPAARRLEFGGGSVLNMPVQTAVKTGTSTDYRDAWAVGYNDRYVAGLWMGNLDGAPTDGVTGSTGPALALRGIFALLNRDRDTAPLYRSPALVRREVKREGGTISELFVPGTEPAEAEGVAVSRRIELVRPTDGLQMAYDPRVPADRQKFRFEIAGMKEGDTARWILNGAEFAAGEDSRLLWPIERGAHDLAVTVYRGDGTEVRIPAVDFLVK